MKKFNVSHNTYKNFKEIEKLPEIGDNYDGRKVIEKISRRILVTSVVS